LGDVTKRKVFKQATPFHLKKGEGTKKKRGDERGKDWRDIKKRGKRRDGGRK